MVENVLNVSFSLANFTKERNTILGKIKKNVCALLNNNGGKLILTASDATANKSSIDADSIYRPIEQCFQEIIGTSKLHNNLKILEQEYNRITVDIKGLPTLCTLNTNLFLPTDRQILLIPPVEHDTVKQILVESRIVDISEQGIPKEFSVGCDSGLRESKTVQFKYLKTEKTTKKDFSDRIINNKVTNFISGFANASGGYIFYGINDDGIVVGQSLSDAKEVENITTKVEEAIRDMKWPEHSGEVERGRQWDITFLPVKNIEGEPIQWTFVIVISVSPCAGGVFTKEPESYHIENGEVRKMDFDLWKSKLLIKDEERRALPLVLKRNDWSSQNSEKVYMMVTERLENLRQLGMWKRIENIAKIFKKRNVSTVNTELVSLFQLVAVNYRQANFNEAEEYLQQLREKLSDAEDIAIFRVEERYSASAIERSRGNYRKSWKIIEDGLQLASDAPAGFVAAAFYLNAASILTNLVNDESFIGVSKHHKDFKNKVGDHVKHAKQLCYLALQHLKYVEEGFEIAREELKQRVSITLAFLYLKSSISTGPCVDTDQAPVSRLDLKVVADKVTESENSLMTLEGTDRLEYNNCRLLLVKSDFHFRHSQLTSESGSPFLHLSDSLRCAKAAQELAETKSFEEIKGYCKSRVDNVQKIVAELKLSDNLKQGNTNEIELDESFVQACLAMTKET